MTSFHAVAFVDHQSAEILRFSSGQLVEQKLHESFKFTRQHGSEVRTEHEFFGHVCDALSGISEVLVLGGHMGLADFKHYVQRHRAHLAPHIIDYQVVDHPTVRQMLALAHQRFMQDELMNGIRVPT
jgi:hypothetical protein